MTEQRISGPDLRADGLALSELPDGAMRTGSVDGEAVMLARRGDGIFAVGAHCTHYSGPLAEGLLIGTTVRCPWHHARFDVRTGEALRAPALNPLPCWDVERRNGRVYVGAKRPERDPLAPISATSSAGRAPATSPASVVIIGAGAAGAAAAEMLRRAGYTQRVTVIDPDQDSPYDRPNLSKDYLAGQAQEEWIPLRPPGFYAEHGIDLLRTRATGLDVSKKRVQLADGKTLDYGALLLATGAEPIPLNVPGTEHPHVRTLRSLADSRAIIADAERHKRAVVVGASFIGLEVAASLRTRKLDVSVVAPESLPLERVLGKDLGAMIKTLHQQQGVKFHLGRKLARIDAKAVSLDDGTSIPADFVVVGIGVRPRLDLAQQAGLAIHRGVVVDAYLRTSASDVYAAGDIARWPDPHSGAKIRVEHWVVAERQGQTAARNILGAGERFDEVPFFWSAHYGAEVTVSYVGHAEQWDRTDIVGDLGKHNGLVAFRAGGRTLAVASVGRDGENLAAEVALGRADEGALTKLVPPPPPPPPPHKR